MADDVGNRIWLHVYDFNSFAAHFNKFMKSAEKELLRSKGSFIIEDMMRLIWPAATIHDILEMHRWCIEMSKEFERKHVKTPPVLDKAELDALLSVFEYFDDDKSGELQIDELIATGLIKQHQAKKMIGEWDKDKSGSMDRWEFVQMLCPTGFRAFKEAKTGSLPDGTRLIFDDQKVCWRPGPARPERDQLRSPASQTTGASSHPATEGAPPGTRSSPASKRPSAWAGSALQTPAWSARADPRAPSPRPAGCPPYTPRRSRRR